MKMTLLGQKMKMLFLLHGHVSLIPNIKFVNIFVILITCGIDSLVDTCYKRPQTLTLSGLALVANNSAFLSICLREIGILWWNFAETKKICYILALASRFNDADSHP